jgi:hypothetical protein
MTISPRRGAGRIDATDPTAFALRSLLQAELPVVLARERHAEIARAVRNERLAVACTPPRRRGLRRAIARALLNAARRLADDVLEPDTPPQEGWLAPR